MIKKIIIWLICVCVCGVVSAQSYHIGDLYVAPDGSKGIVYYLYPDGSGGWVVALNDASAACAWGDESDVPGLLNQNSSEQLMLNDMAGYSNTQLIRNYQNNSSYAAGVVDFAHGWALPSPAQLSMLYARLPMISSALATAGGSEPTTDYYWCSAEHSASNAWSVDFGSTSSYHLYSGQFYNMAKSTTCHVRAVRDFDYSTPESTVSYLWNTGATTSSITVTPVQTTTYSVTVTASDAYPGMEEHTIVVNSPVTEEFSETISGSYTWNDSTYYESGDYTQAFTAANGCDSIVTLHLTMDIIPQVDITVTGEPACSGDSVTLAAAVLNMEALASSTPVAVGDILCTDGTTVSLSDWPAAGKTALGVVFYVDNTGLHGWSVHLQDQGLSVQWAPVGQFVDIAALNNYSDPRDAITDLNGFSNTQNLRNSGNATQYPAAYAVDIDNGWYLPAVGQLRLLFAEFVTLNASLQAVGGTQFPMNNYYFYWTSTEYAGNLAWCIEHSGNLNSYSKNATHRVRSVRNF